MTFAFLLTSLLVVLMPGTGVLYTLAIGLGKGFRPSVAAAFGCTLGIIPAAIASIVGLSALFHSSATIFLIIKYLGAIYLLLMAWQILKDQGVLSIKADKTQKSWVQIAIYGFLINILNPKLSLFFLAFLPQFINTNSSNATLQLFLLAAVFMLITFIVFVLYGATASLTKNHIQKNPAIIKWLKRIFATSFTYLSARLTLSD